MGCRGAARRGAVVAAAVALWLGAVGGAARASAEARASLSNTEAEVGEAVEYSISVSGARGADLKREIAVDGLDIRRTGSSTQVRIVNFDMQLDIVLNFSVVPLREGNFQIPAVEVEAGGKTFTTNPVALTVRGRGGAGGGAIGGLRGGATGGAGGTGAAGAPGDSGQGKAGDLMFAEMVADKQTVFVGEAVPVELRVYVDANVRWQPERMPEFQGDGYTAAKPTQARAKIVTREGRQYNMVAFRSVISAVKDGPVEIGPVTVPVVAELPQPRRRDRAFGSPFRDPFFERFFGDAFGDMAIPRQVTMQAAPLALTVKALPADGRPPSFTGAVGEFTIDSDASPVRVKAGDPVTVTVTVAGRGNFALVKEPQMAADPKWRAYPPAAKFEPEEETEMRGRKRFELALVPENGAATVPVFEFSYFDPKAERYVTLRTDPLPVAVTPAPGATPAAGATAAVPTPAGGGVTPGKMPEPRIAASDILYIRTDDRGWGASFEPLVRRRGFWLAQLAPLTGLLAAAGWRWWRWRQRRANDQRVRWRAELQRLRERVERPGLGRSEFYAAALRGLRLATALATGANPEAVLADQACAMPGVGAELAARVRQVFAAADEMQYAGAGGGDGAVGPAERELAVAVLRELAR